jgi:hypothetical protein
MNLFPCLLIDDAYVPMPRRGEIQQLRLHPQLELGAINASPETPEHLEGVWLYRAGSGVCAVLRAREPVSVRNRRISGLAALHHGDDLVIGQYHGSFCELGFAIVRSGDPLLAQRCTYTHVRIVEGAKILPCPHCGTIYSEPAWEDIKDNRCMQHGCSFVFGSMAGIMGMDDLRKRRCIGHRADEGSLSTRS